MKVVHQDLTNDLCGMKWIPHGGGAFGIRESKMAWCTFDGKLSVLEQRVPYRLDTMQYNIVDGCWLACMVQPGEDTDVICAMMSTDGRLYELTAATTDDGTPVGLVDGMLYTVCQDANKNNYVLGRHAAAGRWLCAVRDDVITVSDGSVTVRGTTYKVGDITRICGGKDSALIIGSAGSLYVNAGSCKKCEAAYAMPYGAGFVCWNADKKMFTIGDCGAGVPTEYIDGAVPIHGGYLGEDTSGRACVWK